MEVAAAVLERALGTENFVALQKEIGQQAVYLMTEAQTEAVVRMQTRKARKGMADAFAASSTQLGKAALAAARKRG